LDPYHEGLAASQSRLKQLETLINDDDEAAKVRRLAAIFNIKADELALTIRLSEAGDQAGALAIVREGRGRLYTVEFRKLVHEIVENETALLAKRQAIAEDQNDKVLSGMILGTLLAVIVIVFGTARTLARIEARSRLLLRGMMAVADGKLDRRVDTESSDGIGKLAQAFNDMADRLLAAKQARETIEMDLAASNRNLSKEVEERTAAQEKLFRSVAELKRSNGELDEFAYSASHDLKAPLRGIRSLTEWIADDVKEIAGADTIANLALLHNRVERLDLLLESLLQYSKVGRAGCTPEDVDIAQLVYEIADYIAPRSGFTVTCRGEMPSIHTDKAPLEQVLRNLIGNGLKHHDRNVGNVVVSARDLGTAVEFRVEDDGPGIPSEFHARVFQMFQTLKSRDEIEGSGMGLAIVKKSVEGHGGTIRIESAPGERGTAFVFTWQKNRLALAA